MKTRINIKLSWLVLFLATLLITPLMVFSAEEEDESEKISPNVSMQYVVINGDEYSLKVTVTHRVKRKRIPLKHVLINLYLNEDTKLGMQGSLNTDENGEAIFPLVEKFKQVKNTLSSYTFLAKIYNDPQVEDGLHELVIRPAKIEMTMVEAEDGRRIQLMLSTKNEKGESIGINESELVVYVERMLSLLPISGDYCITDEDGFVEIELPSNLPGDELGNLNFIARLDEHEEFGTLEARKTEMWGTPKIKEEQNVKALWSSGKNAPHWLLLMSNGIILVVWIVIIYIVTQIRKVHLIGKS
jgi:hypothetical protein